MVPGVPGPAPAERGFTLIEILIALSIMALIVTILYQTFRGSARINESVEREAEAYRAVQIGLSLMAREIRSSYWEKDSDETFFLGTAGSLEFTSFSDRVPVEGTAVPGLVKIRYSLEEASLEPGAPEEDRLHVLVHEEESHPGSLSEKTLLRTELGENVDSLEFRYLTDEGWAEDWATEDRKALPKAVQIRIKVADRPGRLQEFYTVVEVPVGKIGPGS